MRPLIGLTTSEIRRPDPGELIPHADAGREEIVLGAGYIRALAAAGAAPVVIPPRDPDTAQSYLAGLAGVCLSGGPDVDPDSYGAERHPKLGPTVPPIDRFELAVVREAERRGMPLLAICRGAQVLNVAHGGDLVQDVADQVPSAVRHRRPDPGDPVAWHPVDIEPDSLLARAVGGERIDVNSFHHQAPGRVGEGLRVVAVAPVGVVEGLEAQGAAFELGVQWHPEGIADRPEQAALFAAFVDAAGRYAASTESTARSASSSQGSGSAGGAEMKASGIR